MIFNEIIVNQFLQSFSTPLLDTFFKLATYAGHPAPWILLAAWLFWLGYERKSFILVSIILFAGALAGALKLIIARPRPEGILILDPEKTFSMPSGHSTLISAFTIFALKKKTIKKIWKSLLIIAVIIVAISRVYLGAHYISDVIIGLILGSIIGWSVYKAEKKISKLYFHISKIQDEFMAVGVFVFAVIIYILIQIQYPEAFILFGYYSGYALYKHSRVDLKPTQTKKQKASSIIIGTIALGALYFASTFFKGAAEAAVFFTAGLFITIIWPIIIGKINGQEKHHCKNKQ